MKKIICLFLCMVTLTGIFSIGCFAAPDVNADIMPCYNSVSSVSTDFVIDGSYGKIYIGFTGYEGITTGATVTTKVQKKFMLVFWQDVDIGNGTNTWVDNVTGHEFSYLHYFVADDGTHRVTVTYEIRCADGTTETIEEEVEAKR